MEQHIHELDLISRYLLIDHDGVDKKNLSSKAHGQSKDINTENVGHA